MKKWVPALIAVVLIVLVAGGTVAVKLYDKYSYSKEQQDLNEYYHVTEEDQLAIVLQNDLIEEQAKRMNGECYMELSLVQSLLNDKFYYDAHEGLLLYTTPTQIIRNEVGTAVYTIDGEQHETEYPITVLDGDALYLAMDYVQMYTNYSYEYFENPGRIQLRNQWGERNSATLKKKTNVRVKGGIKSPILEPLAEGDSVIVIEEMETWTKVKTSDAVIGYVENKFLINPVTEEEIAPSHYEEPEYTSVRRDHKINLGWHDIKGLAGNGTFDEYVDGTGSMNVISPTWFSLSDNDGSVLSYASRDYVEKAHQRNMEVWALIDNFNVKDIDTEEILSYTSKRTALINTLMNYVNDYGIDGINVDFEAIKVSTGPHFIQFLRELSIACRLNGTVLSVDNYVPGETTAQYDRQAQGEIVDYVIIMGYDEHWGGGGVAGSVASIGFVEEGIVNTLNEVPAEKIINAIPFYTRVWKTSGDEVTSRALGMEATREFIEKYSVPVVWDEETCQNYGEIELNDVLHQVWIEDEKSIETKLTIMKKYNIAGVAAWKLGLQDSSVSKLLDAYVQS